MSNKDKKDFLKFIDKSCKKDMKYDDIKSSIVYDFKSKQKKKSNKLIAILSTCFSIVAVFLITIPTMIHFISNSNLNDEMSNVVPNESTSENIDSNGNGGSTEVTPETDGPAILKGINFDGVYVQTYNNTWPIAFDSYGFDNNFISIKGNFLIPSYINVTDFENFKVLFNENNSPYIISYDPSPNPKDLMYATTFQWHLDEIVKDNLCTFNLEIDLSLFKENNKRLGELILNGNFHVCHNFNGEYIL